MQSTYFLKNTFLAMSEGRLVITFKEEEMTVL